MLKKISIFVVIFAALFVLGLVAQNVIGAGLSKIPIDLEQVPQEDRDKEILRLGIIAELDAINLYEQLAAYATNPHIKELLMDVAREEKTHVGELQALLSKLDEEHGKELEKGKKEVDELLGKEQ
ncbi:MAG: rubrerythrin [Candidatus Omnitrophica bacterium]|nr:rubrerythrin [Candidatus Omnitrophota bacterium]